jgi:hypothetical protein
MTSSFRNVPGKRGLSTIVRRERARMISSLNPIARLTDDTVLDKMARRYAKRKHTARLSKPSISSQRGRPTWAKSHSRADAPMRRKLVLDDAEAANGDKKRGKRKRERSRSFETDDEGDEGSDADADGEEVD